MPAINLPSSNFNIDGSTDKDTLNNILDTLQLYRKELNFLLMNLDGENMPSIIGRIEDGEGNISLINQTIDTIQMTVANNAGDIANLQITADNISAAVANNAGDIAQLSIRADSITSEVANNAGNISTLQQTASGIQTQVSNQAEQISTLTQTAQGLQSQVTNNKNAISTVTQIADGLQSTVISIDDTVGIHSSQITQLDREISSKVSVTDYNGGEIVSLIEQTPYSVKISADKIDLDGITRICSPRYPEDDYFPFYGSGVALYENGIRRLEIYYDGLTSVIDSGPDLLFPGGIRFSGGVDFSNASVYGLDTGSDVDMDYVIECYYRSNKCYIDYGGGSSLTVRNNRGKVVGYVQIT